MLCEWCHSYDERVKYIEERKPENEKEIRLRLMKPVLGELPTEFINMCQELGIATQKHDAAYQEHVRTNLVRGGTEEYDAALKKYDETFKKYDAAYEVCIKMREKYKSIVEELHTQECPNCPWDGETIFSEGEN